MCTTPVARIGAGLALAKQLKECGHGSEKQRNAQALPNQLFCAMRGRTHLVN